MPGFEEEMDQLHAPEFDPREVADLLDESKEGGETTAVNHHQEQRYTISFINGTPGLVIREDYPADMEQAIKDILPLFKRFSEAVESGKAQKSALTTQPSSLKSLCKEHGVEMRSAISKKTGNEYWFHKNQDGAMCFGKGYQQRGY